MENSKAMDTYKPFAKLGQFIKLFEEEFSAEPLDLHRFAGEGDDIRVSELIQNGCDVNEEDEQGCTALYIATSRGHTKTVEILLQNDADVNTKRNPLHVVRNLQCAQLLIQANGDLHARDDFGNSPLQRAIMTGIEDVIEYYLSVGADIQTTNAKGEAPLHTLCSSFMHQAQSIEKIAKRLIQMGANVNCKDSQKRSPLHLAMLHYNCENFKIANILIQAGASITDLDLQGLNPIQHFIERSRGCTGEDEELCMRFIDLLVVDENAANCTNSIGQTILHLAISESEVHVLEYLVKKGCRLDVLDGQKRSLLHYLAERKNCIDVLNYLLEKGLDIDCRDVYGQTSLHLAVEKNNTVLVEALVENGADVNKKDCVGRQALHIAAENGWDFICDCLIKNGANIDAQDKYQSTPLHFAAYNNKPSVGEILIKEDCDVGRRDESGKTAKEIAEFWSSFDFLRVLQENGDDLPHEQRGKLSKYANDLLQLKTFQDVIDSTEESLREPGDLNEYLCGIISKPTIGTVFEDPEAIEIRKAVGKLAMNIAKRISDSHPRMRCSLFHTGSSSEGTKIQYPNEFDYVVCFDELSENIFPELQMEDVQESLSLISNKNADNEEMKELLEEGVDYEKVRDSVSDYTLIFLKEDTNYLYSEYIEMDSRVVPNYTMFQNFTHLVSNIVFGEAFPKDDALLIKDVSIDPKLTLQWRGCRYKSLEINVDFVPAVRLSAWPDKSRIHSKLLDRDLLRLPCLAVPKMTSHQNKDLWRLSLALVENAIMRRCLPRIRNSYIAAKSMINSFVCSLVSFDDYEEAKMCFRSGHDSLSSDEELELYESVEGVLPSYILKMAFFHSIEERAIKDGIESVFNEYVPDEWDNQLTLQAESVPLASKGLDSEIVKDIFKKCDAWLSMQIVPSFFNPRHNVLGSRMLEGDDAKAQYFIKYIKKILNEK